ncbi:MAG TPA: hypothetical protein VF074_20425 [Pyrinomonadaceae bacterium]
MKLQSTLILAGVVVAILSATTFDAKVTIDHNANSVANRNFKFKNVTSPAKDDAASKAKLVLVDGDLDANGADLIAVTDGLLPIDRDEPSANFFFNAGSNGGRFRFEFPTALDVSQVNTYSWHPGSRGPQIYKLYGSDGLDPKFSVNPARTVDPANVGWTLIASVNTVSANGFEGGQYAVSITSSAGSLGKYRHLLFDCFVTETNDDFGNTFYSEIDVIGK